jgi:AraC-like DNA-binding protein
MQLIRHRPAPPLDRYVECLWWSRRDEPQDYCERILPSGGVQLLFALHEMPIICWPGSLSTRRIDWSGGLVHGPQWNYYIAGPKPRGAVAGVAFRPGAAGAVLGLPMAELADHHVPLSMLWGKRGRELHERLMGARDSMDVFSILEHNLLADIQRRLLMHPAIAHVLSRCSPGGPPARVAQVQRETGYSPRHFIALFRAAVGLTPKHYYRIQRFTGVLRALASADERDLAEIAAAGGFADQAHFTREFRELAGITPTQYVPGGVDRPLHHRETDLRGKKLSRPFGWTGPKIGSTS